MNRRQTLWLRPSGGAAERRANVDVRNASGSLSLRSLPAQPVHRQPIRSQRPALVPDTCTLTLTVRWQDCSSSWLGAPGRPSLIHRHQRTAAASVHLRGNQQLFQCQRAVFTADVCDPAAGGDGGGRGGDGMPPSSAHAQNQNPAVEPSAGLVQDKRMSHSCCRDETILAT